MALESALPRGGADSLLAEVRPSEPGGHAPAALHRGDEGTRVNR